MWYIIGALLIWASSFVAGKIAYTGFDPVLTVQFRLIIAGLLVLPFFIQSYKKIPKHLKKAVWLLALANFPLILLLQFVGLNHTSASSAVTLIATEPMMFLLLNHFFFHQKAKISDWILCLVAFVGIFLTVIGDKGLGNVSLFGSILVLIAGFLFAICTLFGKDVIAQIDSKVFTTVTLVLGAVLCLPFTLIFTQNWQINATPTTTLAVLYLGVCCSWLAYRLWNKGIGICPSNTTAILITLEPIFGILLAIIFLGERLTPLMALGSVLVIGAVMLSTILPLLQKSKNPVE